VINYWTDLSIQFASQKNYLDELFKVYPTIPEGIRGVNQTKWSKVKTAFETKDTTELIKNLLTLELFPIKDSYVAYLKRDVTASERNPETVNRLSGRLYEMGLDEIFRRSTEPKETNRQIGPYFKRWLKQETLGIRLLKLNDFQNTEENAILDGGDTELMRFASTHLHYDGTKGLDFLARMHGKYVVGEAKFLTDFGGHQNAQFEDAKTLLRNGSVSAIKIGILDGVLYIKGNNKMYKYLTQHDEKYNIFSSLVLREFLYQIT
jgi:hypothetical protein